MSTVRPGASPDAGPHAGSAVTSARWQRLLGPLVLAGVALAATAYVAAVDPNEPGHYLPCPTRALLGIDCPACGGLRAVHALAHGDIGRALDHNALVVLAIPVLVVAWVIVMHRAWTGRVVPVTDAVVARRRLALRAVLVLLVVFMVVRNLVPVLGSAA